MTYIRRMLSRRAFGLAELMIAVSLAAFILYFAWEFYFKGSATTKHVSTMSKLQADGRIFLGKIYQDTAMAYCFESVDEQAKSFTFIKFRAKVPDLEDMVFMGNSYQRRSPLDYNFPVSRVEYKCDAKGVVTRKEEGGDLYFQKVPVEFRPNPALGGDTAARPILYNISSWSVKLYQQKIEVKVDGANRTVDVKVTPITQSTVAAEARKATFATLLVRSFVDDKANIRDEDLQIAVKLYSRYRTMAVNNPSYFCSVDDAQDF